MSRRDPIEVGMRLFDSSGPPLPQGLIYLAAVGADAHGLVTDQSDFDFGGIFVRPLTEFLRVVGHKQDTIESTGPDQDVDIYFHEISKFAVLAGKGNPSALNLLFSPITVYKAECWGSFLVQHRQAFVSRRALRAYHGYFDSQLARWKGGRPLHTTGGKYNGHYACHMIRLMWSAYMLAKTETVCVRIEDKAVREFALACKQGEISEQDAMIKCEFLKAVTSSEEERSSLRDEPDWDTINRVVYDIRLYYR